MSTTTQHNASLFRLVLLVVLGIALFSGLGDIGITFCAPPQEWPRFAPLADTFSGTFKSSIVAVISLLGGKALR